MTEVDLPNRYSPELFNATKWRRYHADRIAHYERLDRWVTFASVILGSVAFSNVAVIHQFSPHQSVYLAMIIAVMNAAKLVFEFTKNSQLHRNMHREMTALCVEISRNLSPTLTERTQWDARMIEINSPMHRTFWALEAHAFNQTVVEFRDDLGPPIKIGLPYYARNYLTFSNDNFAANWDKAKKDLRPEPPARGALEATAA